MASLKHPCPTCHKDIKSIQAEFPVGNLINYVYNCGHIELRPKIELVTDSEVNDLIKSLEDSINLVEDQKDQKISFQSIDEELAALIRWDEESPSYEKGKWEGPKFIPEVFWSLEVVPEYFCKECKVPHRRKHLYEFQRTGVDFALKANSRCLIADEMGLGKTPQAIITVKENKKELLPVLVIVKGATQFNWVREFHSWAFNGFADIMPVTHRSHIMPGFKIYVISMDLLGRKGILNLLSKLNLKCVILDECQNFKDSSSKRTVALIKLLQDNNIEHLLSLSGTPIMNRASEYFVILNLLAPAHFSSYAGFCRQWLVANDKGYPTKLNPTLKNRFHEVTSRWILRREAKDVAKDLPELRINYKFIEIEDDAVKRSYNHQLDLFNNFLRNNSKVGGNDLLGWIAKLSAITEQAKVPAAVEFIDEFFDSNEEDLISIGIHHRSCKDTLKYVYDAKGVMPLVISGDEDNWSKDRIARQFSVDKKSRLLILNTIAGGVGLNLQGCNNFVAISRFWNGANQDQFHKRFQRDGQKKNVLGTYLLALGTIDEWYQNMVFEKRGNTASIGIGDNPDETTSMGFLREFAEFVVNKKI